MAGERSKQMMRVSARAAIRNLRMINVIEDSYGDPFAGQKAPDLDEIMFRLAHNDTEAIAKALPSLMAEAMNAEQE
jgi:hypothetical protein